MRKRDAENGSDHDLFWRNWVRFGSGCDRISGLDDVPEFCSEHSTRYIVHLKANSKEVCTYPFRLGIHLTVQTERFTLEWHTQRRIGWQSFLQIGGVAYSGSL